MMSGRRKDRRVQCRLSSIVLHTSPSLEPQPSEKIRYNFVVPESSPLTRRWFRFAVRSVFALWAFGILLLAYREWRERARYALLSDVQERTSATVEFDSKHFPPSRVLRAFGLPARTSSAAIVKKISFRTDDPPDFVARARLLWPEIQVTQETTPRPASTTPPTNG
jgi:hypothetical protein